MENEQIREFKIGDKVKIPSEPDSEWSWVSGMDETCGMIGTIKDNNTYEGLVVIFEDYSCFLYHPSYLLTEPYNQREKTMKAEDIDLKKSQMLDEPVEGFEFSDNGDPYDTWLDYCTLYAIDMRSMFPYKVLDRDGDVDEYKLCRPIQAQPKTRPMTHFEIMKLDAVFCIRGKELNLTHDWGTYRDVGSWEYCLRSDFNKAESLEDVVWKKLEVEE